MPCVTEMGLNVSKVSIVVQEQGCVEPPWKWSTCKDVVAGHETQCSECGCVVCTWGCASPSFCCPIEPTFLVTNMFLLRGISLPTLPQISQRTRGAFGRNANKTRKYDRVELAETHCLRIPMLAEFCQSACHKKKHQRSNATVERGPFFDVLSSKKKKRYPSTFRHLPCFIASHRTNMSSKRIFVVTERCFFGTVTIFALDLGDSVMIDTCGLTSSCRHVGSRKTVQVRSARINVCVSLITLCK